MKNESESRRYHIGTVAKITGLSTHTIRVWERRYAAVVPGRSPGGTREYSEADVDRLLLLHTLTNAGFAIGQIAQLPGEELQEMLAAAEKRGLVPSASPSAPTPARHVDAFMQEILRLDPQAAERVLLEAAASRSPVDLVFDVIAPIVENIGRQWASGEIRIAHEHAATATLRTFLGSFLSSQVMRPSAPLAVTATLSGEQHELGALMASFVAVSRGWRVLYLGPNLPPLEVVHSVRQSQARLLLLSLVNPVTPAVEGLVTELACSLPEEVALIAGGRSAPSYASLLRSANIITSLRELFEHLSLRVGATRADESDQTSQ